MDIKEFFDIHTEKNTLNSVLEGVSQSCYAETDVEIHEFVKILLNKLLESNEKIKYNYLQSGGLSTTFSKQKDVDKKQSYCTDFNAMLNNIIALLGYEFSKYLIYLSTLKHLLEKIIKMFDNAISYDELLFLVSCIENLYKLGENSQEGETLKVSSDFPYKKYIYSTMNRLRHTSTLSYDTKIEDSSLKDEMFNQKKDKLNIDIKSGSVINFEKDKRELSKMFQQLLEYTDYQPYVVSSIDKLCINLGNFNVGYDGSFLKLFDMLYRENYSDVPRDFLEPVIYSKVLPHIDYIKEMEIGSCDPYLEALRLYYKKTYSDIYKMLNTLEDDIEINEVDVTAGMYEYLAHVTLNLFIQLTKILANNQMIQIYFGKSTRIQFTQILISIYGCLPKLQTFTESQKNVLHYFMLSKKTLYDSLNIINK